jgi:hypothetical protein
MSDQLPAPDLKLTDLITRHSQYNAETNRMSVAAAGSINYAVALFKASKDLYKQWFQERGINLIIDDEPPP